MTLRKVWWALAALSLMAVFVRLGFWQLSRAEEKAAWASALQAAAEAPPLDNADWIASSVDTTALHRRASLEGEWWPEHAVYLENRTMGGGTGFVLVMPLALDARHVVVVQRGWLPRHQVDPTRLAPVDTPSGRVRVEGVISAPPSQYFSLGDGARSGPVRSNLDWSAYAQELHRDIGAVSVRQTGPDSEGLRRAWDPIDAKIPTHYGYAVQWFALAALTVFLYVWLQIIQPKRRRD